MATYKPLGADRKEIRLLTVHHGRDEVEVTASLETFTLAKASRIGYETISYAWGDGSLRDAIKINGQEASVPASAVAAIRCIRLQHTSKRSWQSAIKGVRHSRAGRRRWIDSVCIHQHDMQERSQQVGMMAAIYQKSQGNLIYLGPDTGLMSSARSSIRMLCEEAESESRGQPLYEFIIKERSSIYANGPVKAPIEIQALVSFYDCSWFEYEAVYPKTFAQADQRRRLWVLQEVVLAPRNTVHRGDLQMSLRDIIVATAWLHHKQLHLPGALTSATGYRTALNMWNYRESPTMYFGTNVLWSILGSAGGLKCSDVRDKGFGVVGLYQRHKANKRTALPSALQPDYQKDVAAILRDATRQAIIESRCLSISGYSTRRLCGIDRLTSWVTEWFRKPEDDDDRPFAEFFDVGRPRWWISAASQLESDLGPDVWLLDGVTVDTVSSITPKMTGDLLLSVHRLIARLREISTLAAELGVRGAILDFTLIPGTTCYGRPAQLE
ncbi:Uu.00g125950.m01.CDS01 [Anthostomella pinea]|uniref:Uu.00g125950.m01.CDS01 n=1 Tax=Anthostomella pinea TaxID=933095 RepID=A0AAI8VIJ6_9PEZI|nr:Uu.00g125950.m01.CDS01 [Anthostomella pinea]